MKIKVNDTVLVTTGKYKGKTGKVLRIYKKTNKATVEKINIITKHIKKSQTRPGERIQYEAPLNASNVKVICPHCAKATRAGYKLPEKGKKFRICKKCNENLDINVTMRKSTKKKNK